MDTPYLIRNAHLVDVAKGTIVPNRSVVLKNGRIDEILDSSGDVPTATFDATGLYLCPGLIDCHVHFFLDGGHSPRTSYVESDDDTKMRCARHHARKAIEAGITTMRDCGAPAPLMFEFQRQVERGDIPGPHIISCGSPLMRPGGHCHFMGGEVATVEDVRRRIEWHLRQGAGFVKLMASGGGLTPGTKPHEADLPLELMVAAAEVAHACGVQITAHCHATESMTRAMDSGLDMIEHASFVESKGGYRYDREIAQRIRNQGVIVCPTVIAALRTVKRFRESGKPHNENDLAAVERLEGRLTNTGELRRLGVKIIGGTDCGATDTPFDVLVDEVLAYTEVGFSNAEALRAVTSNSTVLMNLSKLGEVKIGYRADLILLEANPLEDLNALRRPLKVFKSGKVIHERRARSVADE